MYNYKIGDYTIHFPVSYSTLSQEALRKYVSETYGLNNIEEFSYLLRGMNDTYLVKTSSAKYVFRIYRADRRMDVGEVAFEIDLLNFLNQRGIPVSLAVADHSGQFIQILKAPEGDRYGVLFTFAEGLEKPVNDEKISYLFGKAVADIHKAADDFTSEFTRQPLDLKYLLHQSMSWIRPHLNHRNKDLEWLESL
ncbi:phosphotransferase [Paenibacillus lemnae]|uniref:Phosphotransferase n=1 Tax=Paenibacillus lemnae TaxID=1330551 RepID=A0A848M9F4_PAELE|nr:phosphotransferase [Paenibacillus lemnae]NMO97687.1 phosphotransferase [Paenibacillus lemnae]